MAMQSISSSSLAVNQKAAKRFFRKLLKGQGRPPWQLVTDKLRSYSAAHREVMPSVVHDTDQYRNNLAEVSHEPTRQRERQMRKFQNRAPSGVVLSRCHLQRLPRFIHSGWPSGRGKLIRNSGCSVGKRCESDVKTELPQASC